MMAALKAIKLWGPHLPEDKRLCLFIDNTAVVCGLTKHSIRGEAMAPLRKLLLLAAAWDIEVVPRWIPTLENTLAYALSRHERRKIAEISPMSTQAALCAPPGHRPLYLHPSPSKRKKKNEKTMTAIEKKRYWAFSNTPVKKIKIPKPPTKKYMRKAEQKKEKQNGPQKKFPLRVSNCAVRCPRCRPPSTRSHPQLVRVPDKRLHTRGRGLRASSVIDDDPSR
jgi:hypothetical protein